MMLPVHGLFRWSFTTIPGILTHTKYKTNTDNINNTGNINKFRNNNKYRKHKQIQIT